MRLKRKRMGVKTDLQSENINLFTFDINVKYDLNEAFGNTKALSPYLIGGLGYTYRALPSRKNAITANIGLGFNIWIRRGFGLNVQSIAKFALNKADSKNYLMHTLGVVYRFNLLRGYITPNRLGYRHSR
jgi:type IV secretory pathway TrbD component